MVEVPHSKCAVLRIVEEDVVAKEKVGSHHQKVPLRGGEVGGEREVERREVSILYSTQETTILLTS